MKGRRAHGDLFRSFRGLSEYSVSETTLEQLFIQFAKHQDEVQEKDTPGASPRRLEGEVRDAGAERLEEKSFPKENRKHI